MQQLKGDIIEICEMDADQRSSHNDARHHCKPGRGSHLQQTFEPGKTQGFPKSNPYEQLKGLF